MSQALHNAFIADATMVRETLAELDVASFNVSITIEGRTLSDADQCKITYEVGNGHWGSACVKGDSIESCLHELMRRLGWNQEHAPLALPKPRWQATES